MNPEEFTVERRSLSNDLIAELKRLFLELGAWRASDAQQFMRQAVPALQGAQRQLASLTAVYVASQASAALGRTFAPVGIPQQRSMNLRRGVDTPAVYRRPFTTVYNALSKDTPLDRAVELGATRLGQIAEMDLQATYAHASQYAQQALPAGVRPEFWRRVLVGPKNCALCVVASTQRYRVETLNPIHPVCDCRVEPIFGRDPGQVIDPGLLEKVHSAVEDLTGQADRGARAPDYRQIVVESTAEHGELGALLVRPRDNFTGPADV